LLLLNIFKEYLFYLSEQNFTTTYFYLFFKTGRNTLLQQIIKTHF